MSAWLGLPLVQSLGWALLHSLWQGALVSVLALAALRLAKHLAAEVRYAIALGSLGLVVLGFVGTLLWMARGGEPLPAMEVSFLVPFGEGQGVLGWATRVRAHLSASMPWLILAWSLGVTLRLLYLARSVVWLYGPCLRSMQAPPAFLARRFEAIRSRCRTRIQVRLGISDQVDSLLVLGWLKPVVLVPAAALMALTPEVIEALLIHELAHVRRGDFLANLLQSLAESLLFYHPAIWWLSRRIRQEREHCCDDAAVIACGDPMLYASALLGLEELRSQSNLLANLAPSASGGRLMHRIQRLVRPRTMPTTPAPLAAILPALFLTATLGAATLTPMGHPAPPKDPPARAEPAGPVDLPFKKVRVRRQPEAPAYPPEAKAAGIQGTVVVSLTIDVEGKVSEARAISGPPELHACAVGYARGWEFEPVKVEGNPVSARFKLTMPFRLR